MLLTETAEWKCVEDLIWPDAAALMLGLPHFGNCQASAI